MREENLSSLYDSCRRLIISKVNHSKLIKFWSAERSTCLDFVGQNSLAQDKAYEWIVLGMNPLIDPKRLQHHKLKHKMDNVR